MSLLRRLPRLAAALDHAGHRIRKDLRQLSAHITHADRVLDLGSGSTVYNTIQMDESARVARTVNDRVLKVLKASLAPLADLGESAVSGVRVDTKILSRNFVDRGAEPSIDAVQIYAPRELVRKFADADITSQQLIDGCVVLVNDNRVQVLLGAGAR